METTIELTWRQARALVVQCFRNYQLDGTRACEVLGDHDVVVNLLRPLTGRITARCDGTHVEYCERLPDDLSAYRGGQHIVELSRALRTIFSHTRLVEDAYVMAAHDPLEG